MGKADYKKINDRWCGEEEMDNRAAINEFYAKAAQDRSSTGKKKKSKTKTKRADHKHLYEDVLITNYILPNGQAWGHLMLGQHCTICGKVAVKKYMLTKKDERGWYEVMDNEEIIHDNRYTSLPIIDAEREGLKCL